MLKSAELLKKSAITLEKYKKNKTLVSPEDLAGKYKVPFEKLKAQLADELSEYLKEYSLEQLILSKDDRGCFEEFAESVNRIFAESDMSKRIGIAAFEHFDLGQVKQLAEELRIRIYNEAWVPYFQKHICLYTLAECFAEDNPQKPRLYNSLVEKFWDEESGEWIEDKAAPVPALLFYIQASRKEKIA